MTDAAVSLSSTVASVFEAFVKKLSEEETLPGMARVSSGCGRTRNNGGAQARKGRALRDLHAKIH
jgi:hypothetical protein